MSSIASAPLCGIYAIRCDKKVYIGSSIDIERRWQQHRRDLRSNTHSNSYLQRAWNKHGASAFVFEIIELTLEVMRLDRETYWIQKLHTANPRHGYNLGLSAIDRSQISEATRAKLSAASKGRVYSAATIEKRAATLRGRPMSTVARANMSAAHKGQVQSEECIAKRVASRKGYTHSTETRTKIGAAHKGLPVSDKVRAAFTAANTDRMFTPEHRAKLSAAKRARDALLKAKKQSEG